MKKLLLASVLVVTTAALAASTAAGSTQVTKQASVTIVHVQKGCHIFSGVAGKGARLKLSIARGGSVTILNQDIDGHKLVQTAGAVKLKSRGLQRGLKMNDRAVLTFVKPGVYAFATKAYETKGMPEVKTMGTDNMLRLTVTVVS